MDIEELKNLFEKHGDSSSNFEEIDSSMRKSKRADLHAFLLLDSILPGNNDIVAASEHDIIYLGVELEEFAKVATENIILDLIRCGVFIDDDTELAMFT